MGGRFWNVFLNILYPPKCPACRAFVEQHGAWCPACLATILAVRQINTAEHRLQFLDSCRVVCEYTGGLKRVIHDMKFRQQKKYGVHLQWLLAGSQLSLYAPVIDYVVPVPLHQERLQERGYNQAEVIFKKWARQEKLVWQPDLLMRCKSTVPQWELPSAERRANIKGAFAVTRPEMVKTKHILLADDIITTGITLDECARVMKKSGAASVHALAVASGAR